MLKTVKECEYCSEQIDWTDMQPKAVPDGWRTILVITLDDMGKEDSREAIEICGNHGSLSLTTIIASAMS